MRDPHPQLYRYLRSNRIRVKDFAALFGWSPSYTSQLLRRIKRPGLRNAALIERATGGAVPASSWIDPEPQQENPHG